MNVGDRRGAYVLLEALDHDERCGYYLGCEGRTKQLVTIKMLFSELARDEGAVRRFQRECEILKALDHPNIIAFCAAGHADGSYYIVTELVKGKALDQILSEVGRLPVEHAVKIAGHVADGLAHAHAHGVVHRNVKPRTILIREEDGAVKLHDFGLAFRDDSLVREAGGAILGTFCYGSPEQNQGKKVDGRADLYSLGLVLHELLTGQRALRGGSLLEITAFQMRGAIPPPSALAPDVPPALDRIVAKLLDRDPAQRFASATELARELRGFAGGGPAHGGRPKTEDQAYLANVKLAEEALLVRHLDQALKFASRALELAPDTLQVLLLLGKVHAAMQNGDEALALLGRAVNLAPDDPAVALERGVAFYGLGLFGEAAAELERCLKLEPGNDWATRYLQRARERKG